jgi:Ca2+-binding EF-hand superfamily protein
MDVEKVRANFNKHDHDKDGEIDLVEIVEILGELKIFSHTGLDVMTRFGRNGRINFEQFWDGICTVSKEDEQEDEDLEHVQEKEDKERYRSGSILFQGKVLYLSEDDEY